jgi:glycosyltransferase involved in cell wall biosynthesis
VNILNIIQCTNLGGMERASLRLMRELQVRGHACRVLSLNPIGEIGPLLAKDGVPAIGLRYRGPAGLATLPEYYRCLRTRQATTDAIIMTGHNLMAMIGLGDLCTSHRVLAIHFHHTGVKPPWAWRLIYRLAEKRFQAITYPSDFIREEAKQLYPPIARISHTVRLPLTVPEEPPSADVTASRARLGLPNGTAVIGNAGWLIPRKRWDVFLKVAQQVSAQCRDVAFLVAGDGPLRKTLEEQACTLGIAGRVRWLGWCKDLTDFFRSIDVLLFNSDWDAFPVSPQEAMTHGKPVVASVLNGGLKEVFAHAHPGLLLDRHDINQLAEAVLYFIANPTIARKYGLAGREVMARLGHAETIVSQYEKLLQITP